MSKSKSSHVLTLSQLQEGYPLAVENAIRSFGASTELLTQFPDKALALAQLGQEELGKSLTILAAARLPPDPQAWQWFWKGWRDHQLKAHRAYLYEIIHPLRVELTRPDGTTYAGRPLFDRLSAEKEIGFYVDYNPALKVFTAPEQQVDMLAAGSRISTLAYLGATADAVCRTLTNRDYDFRFQEFGQLAFRICSENIYQQHWPAIRDAFATLSHRHRTVIEDLQVALLSVEDLFKSSHRSHKPESR